MDLIVSVPEISYLLLTSINVVSYIPLEARPII